MSPRQVQHPAPFPASLPPPTLLLRIPTSLSLPFLTCTQKRHRQGTHVTAPMLANVPAGTNVMALSRKSRNPDWLGQEPERARAPPGPSEKVEPPKDTCQARTGERLASSTAPAAGRQTGLRSIAGRGASKRGCAAACDTAEHGGGGRVRHHAASPELPAPCFLGMPARGASVRGSLFRGM